MFTTATLSINAFSTELKLTGDNWQPGQPHERINVLGKPGTDWDRDYVTYFRTAADGELARHGYGRIGGWAYEAGRDAHVAAINKTETA